MNITIRSLSVALALLTVGCGDSYGDAYRKRLSDPTVVETQCATEYGQGSAFQRCWNVTAGDRAFAAETAYWNAWLASSKRDEAYDRAVAEHQRRDALCAAEHDTYPDGDRDPFRVCDPPREKTVDGVLYQWRDSEWVALKRRPRRTVNGVTREWDGSMWVPLTEAGR